MELLVKYVLFLLDFSNTISQASIKGMAEADDHETVKELQVCWMLAGNNGHNKSDYMVIMLLDKSGQTKKCCATSNNLRKI